MEDFCKMGLISKNSKLLVFALAVTLLPGAAFLSSITRTRAATGVPVAVFKSSDEKYPKTISMLDAFVLREMEDKKLPGVAIALVHGQQIIWQKGYGYSDPKTKTPITSETIFRVGSVSKLFTDIAVMQLVEKGDLDLDAAVTKYIPEFTPENPFKKSITLRQLMSHRAGLVREPPVGSYFESGDPTLSDTIKSLNKTALVYKPESRHKYSNAGIAAVGYVLEKTKGRPFADYLKDALLAPLGMQNTSFKPTPATAKRLAHAQMWTVFGKKYDAPTFELGIAPAGSMYTTTGDLATFAGALFSANKNAPGAFLKKKTLEQMWTPQFSPSDKKNGAGLGFFVSDLQGHRKVGHGGAIYGFSTQLSVLPDDELAVVVVSTKDLSNGVTTRIADIALSAMLAEGEDKPVPQPVVTGEVDSALAAKIAGRYSNGESSFELIEYEGGLLLFNTAGGPELRLRSSGNGLVADDLIGFGIRVVPNIKAKTIDINGKAFQRVAAKKPKPASNAFKGLIGEYGPDYNTTYVFERDGKLWLLVEQFEFDPLEQESENVFTFPNHGLYHGEKVVFRRDRNGRATQLTAAGVTFERRQVGPGGGAPQLLIDPVRPVRDLIKEALAAEPPEETGDFLKTDLVELIRFDKTLRLDIRYATSNNLFGTVFYSQPRAFMQRPAAEAVVRVNKKLRKKGYGLLIHDAYRPWYVTKVFWDATPEEKKLFVADPSKGSRHNRGAAVDITLFDLKTGKHIDMVGTYDETTDRSYPHYPGGTSLQRWHREFLRNAMESEGFTVYEAEWWHFDYDDWRNYRIGNERFEKINSNR
jgi:serine beta-lactamase-like protein LACTB